MKSPDRHTLLTEILAGDELEELRQISIAKGLAAIRRKRRNRILVRVSLGILAPALIAYSVMRWHSEPVSLIPKTPELTRESGEPDRVPLISDDELLALFPDLGVALIGKPGSQKLMVFDKRSL